MKYIKEMISVNMLISIFNFDWIKQKTKTTNAIKCTLILCKHFNYLHTNTDNKL